MGDSNKMEKIPIHSYDIYSERTMLDKRSFPEWIEENRKYAIPSKSMKRGKFGNEVRSIMDGVDFDVSISDRKDSHKSFYIEPKFNRRHIQNLSPYCSLNND
jgi:hypothetical protein